ncbi:MAG: FAD-binding oxidoreductase [Thermoplasmatales archaeon]|nr:FAD-binding oxidoreductase [Candidatus Thermoplasmatota archaeon]MCL6002671.1 FAD-binding oxidoreductase [Candidatus Thermoplasmatota archaeon]MDA8054813.1 FAD-binding oxidoreductase [Thermoplasmatales archaeon]
MNGIYASRPIPVSLKEQMKRIIDPSLFENYLSDESKIIEGKATEVVLPRSEQEVSEILKKSNLESIHVTISGAGTGLTGSRIPTDGIVLSTEELTEVATKPSKKEEVLRYEENGKTYSIIIGKEDGNYYSTAPPAIPIAIFEKIIERKNLIYPPDPTETNAFLGGTIATNASGSRTFFYGPTRNFVRRLRVVLPNGDVLNVKRGETFAEESKFVITLTNGEKREIQIPNYVMPNVEKNSAGYYVKPGMDLIDLFIGSEGTLGVFSEIEVKLIEKPKGIVPIFAHFKKEDDSIKFFKKLRSLSKSEELKVLSIEFFDSHSVDFLKQKYSTSKIPKNSRSIIDFELEIQNIEKKDDVLEYVSDFLLDCDMLDAFVMSETDAKEIRHSLPENINGFIRSHGTEKTASDVAVPEDAFDAMWEWYHKIAEETSIGYVIFGHIGNFHLHFNFLPVNNEELVTAQKAIVSILKKAVELGGTITAEHGIGKKYYMKDNETKPLISIMYKQEDLIQIGKVKHEIDVNCILNIGNVIPRELITSSGSQLGKETIS